MKLNNDNIKYDELYKNGFLFDGNTQTIYTDKKKPIIPEAYIHWEVENVDFKKYMAERLKELGITEAKNKIDLIGGVNLGNDEKTSQKVFDCNKFGDIQILQYGLDRRPHTFFTKGGESSSTSNREEYHLQTRLHPLHADMKEGKYDFSKAKNVPFWHKSLIDLYENEKDLDQLSITEGQIKAFKASMDSIHTVGLTSISHYKDKKTNTIHGEIVNFIRTCNVKDLVILWDGDCRNISSKALAESEDLTTRPYNFYKFASTIRELLQEFFPPKKLNIYFATIKTDELKENPKGIDDLLIEYSKEVKEVRADYKLIGVSPCKYFEWINITTETGVKKMRKYFNIDSVKSFYQYHQEQIKESDFVYIGATYRVEKGEPLKKIDANVKNYKRIGIDYYKLTKEPVPTGRKNEVTHEEVLTPWNKTSIVDDHGKDIIKHVERFEGFTNIASHTDYQQHIGTYWNLYYNVDHNSIHGEWKHVEILLKHLFAEQYTMVLDYLTILYRRPMQKLPVICLVSKEQGTGKSTFVYLMKLIFKQNMSIISNSDLVGDFNSHWTSKLVVASEETILEKKDAYEKIKALSTAKTIQRNEKNKTAKEIPCMVHFVFCSNHEDDFIKIDDYDSRLWIRKVHSIKGKEDKHFDEKLENEIPYFIDFIQNREIEYEQSSRLYFHPTDFRTDAFNNIVKHSEPVVIKELRANLEDSFLTTGCKEQRMDAKLIKEYFGIRFDLHYINKSIKQFLKLEQTNSSFSFHYVDALGEIKKKTKKGRFYTFKREDFVSDEPKALPEDLLKERFHQTTILEQ